MQKSNPKMRRATLRIITDAQKIITRLNFSKSERGVYRRIFARMRKAA